MLDAVAGVAPPVPRQGVLVCIKQQMIRSARRVVLVADHTKFGRQSTAKIAGLDQVHCVISDSEMTPEVALALREHHIEVRFASLHD